MKQKNRDRTIANYATRLRIIQHIDEVLAETAGKFSIQTYLHHIRISLIGNWDLSPEEAKLKLDLKEGSKVQKYYENMLKKCSCISCHETKCIYINGCSIINYLRSNSDVYNTALELKFDHMPSVMEFAEMVENGSFFEAYEQAKVIDILHKGQNE